jgi:SAM-dependent methyltransferase
VCGSEIVRPAASASEIAREFEVQRRFVLSRLHVNPSPEELKDLTDFMHDSTAPLVRCANCGLLQRAEAQPENSASYEEDPNDPDVMAQVYPRYVQAFRNKREAYESLLQPRADVLELGPHIGGFLQAAEEWDWRPVGVDVGIDTTSFIKRNGLRVIRGTLDDCKLKDGSFDAVFVWNCFEQLDQPAETLAAIRRLLKKKGILVARVPNALFYRMRRATGRADKALAYNNLLGFPYLYGYSLETLNRLMAACGFSFVRGFNSELVTTPFAGVSTVIEQEQQKVSRAVAEWSTRTTRKLLTLTGPWIEGVYRKCDHPEIRDAAEAIDPRFLKRAVA